MCICWCIDCIAGGEAINVMPFKGAICGLTGAAAVCGEKERQWSQRLVLSGSNPARKLG
jgi:hypothetical protein